MRALSDVLGHRLGFDSLVELRAALFAHYPHFAAIDQRADIDDMGAAALPTAPLIAAPFATAVSDFYLTNPIARASKVMAECSALAQQRMQQAAE
jgi:NADH-quinone oxidoreductase subunit G